MGRTKGALGRKKLVTVVPPLDPTMARIAVAKHLTHLTSMRSVNMAQFRAQVHEEEAIETLVNMMRDEEMSPSLRRQCAIDVVTYARGVVKTWAHAGETIQPEAVGDSGNTIGAEIAAARSTAELYEKMALNVAQGIHPDDWTDDIRKLAGETIEHYSQPGAIIDQ